MEDKIKISFDNEYKIRVLEPEKFSKAEDLEKECTTFVEKITTFSEKVNGLVTVLESHAERIDSEKLRAIGLRIAAENEADQRNRQQRALQVLINEKKAELERYSLQYQSLEHVESEQNASLEKMSNTNSNAH